MKTIEKDFEKRFNAGIPSMDLMREYAGFLAENGDSRQRAAEFLVENGLLPEFLSAFQGYWYGRDTFNEKTGISTNPETSIWTVYRDLSAWQYRRDAFAVIQRMIAAYMVLVEGARLDGPVPPPVKPDESSGNFTSWCLDH